jgi:hypothetical protein
MAVKAKLKVEFSNNYRRLMNQFPRLPRECMDVFRSAVKRDALLTIQNFKEGIKKNSLGLVKLKDGTITRKRRDGMTKPTYPLYGLGDERKKDSYMNMLRIKENPNSVVVSPSKKKHHSQNITLKKLWFVHEHGMTIKGKGGALIRIPARPALKKAFNRAMHKRKIRETSMIIKTAIVTYIVKKNKSFLKMAQEHFLKGLEGYAIHD